MDRNTPENETVKAPVRTTANGTNVAVSRRAVRPADSRPAPAVNPEPKVSASAQRPAPAKPAPKPASLKVKPVASKAKKKKKAASPLYENRGIIISLLSVAICALLIYWGWDTLSSKVSEVQYVQTVLPTAIPSQMDEPQGLDYTKVNALYQEIESYRPASTMPPEYAERWELVLVSTKFTPDTSYTPEDTTTLKNKQKVDSRVMDFLQPMFDDARAAGVNPQVGLGYIGRNDDPEVDCAKEHRTGLAIDVIAGEGSTQEEVNAWMLANAAKYGFILRYPEGKEAVTGQSYNPSHYRFVGVEVAQIIMSEGSTLEEYLGVEG